MNTFSRFFFLAKLRNLLLLSLGLFLSASLLAQEAAQEEVDVRDLGDEELAVRGEKALVEGNFSFAEAAFGEMMDRYTIQDAKDKFGGIFGSIIYGRGIARMQQQNYDGAIEDFRSVMDNFPDNPFSKRAALMLSRALLEKEQFEESTTQLMNFMRLANEREKEEIGYELIYLIYARAYLGLAKLAEAKPYIVTLAGVKGFPEAKRVRPQAGVVMDLFLRYAKIAVENKQFDELREMAQTIRSWSVNRPHELLTARTDLFSLMQAVERENAAENLDLCLLLLSLVPQEQQIRDSIELVAGSLPDNHPQAQFAKQVLAELDRFAQEKEPYDVTILFYQANLLQRAGQASSALAVYQYILEAFPEDINLRPQVFYSTVIAAVGSGNFRLVQGLAEQFFEQFPDNQEFGPLIRRYSLESVFYAGNYAEALKLAREVRPSFEDGSEQAQICDFVIGGSLYYLNQIGEAQQALAAWMDTYGELENVSPERKEFVSYAQVDLLSRANQWAALLRESTAFLGEFPQAAPARLGQVYLFKATAENRTDNPQQANETLQALKGMGEAYDQLKDRALVLDGEVLSSLEKKDEALASWKEAFEVAESFLNESVAAQALYLIIATFSEDEQKRAEVIAAFEKFTAEDKLKQTGFYPSVATASSNALIAEGRLNDALAALEESMKRMDDNVGFDAMGRVVRGFAQSFLSTVEDEELPVRLGRVQQLEQELERIAGEANATSLRASTLLESANYYRMVGQDAEGGTDVAIEAGARVRQIFLRLDQNFDPKDLNPDAIFSLADYLFAEGDFARAQNYYEGAFEGAKQQNNLALLPKAAIGLGRFLLQDGKGQNAQRAADLLKEVNPTNYPNAKAMHGEAMFWQAQAEEKLQNWGDALKLYKDYLDGPWKKHAPQAHFQFAEIEHLQNGNEAAAVQMYARIVNFYARDFVYAIPALKREIKLRRGLGQDQESLFKRLDAAHASYQPSMNQTTLIKAGFTREQTTALLGEWREIESLHQELAPAP